MNDQNMMICPHCRSEIPRGANICRGCRAEIKYGAPTFFIFIAILAPFFFAVCLVAWLYQRVGTFSDAMGWIAVAIFTLVGWFLFFKLGQKIYSGKVRFIR